MAGRGARGLLGWLARGRVSMVEGDLVVIDN